jgi:hypothetical protein
LAGRIRDVSDPGRGAIRVSDQVRLKGISLSPSAVRNLWHEEKLETRYKRILRPEEENHGHEIELTQSRYPPSEEGGYRLPGAVGEESVS